MKRILILIVIVVSILLVAGGIVYGLYWADQRQNNFICLQMDIAVERGNTGVYLKEEDIKEYLQKARIIPEGKAISRINTSAIEAVLNDNPYISNADVYIGVDKIVYVLAHQRQAVLRVLNRGYESYYLDKDGVIMPVNPKYVLRTRLVNGNIGVKKTNGVSVRGQDSSYSRKMLEDVFILSEYIRKDPFLDAQIEQIYVTQTNEIELYPKLGGQVILFGGIEDMEGKLERLKLVYKKGFAKVGWNVYKSINLKYKNQVVCTKI